MPGRTRKGKRAADSRGRDALEHIHGMMAASPGFAALVREELEKLEIAAKIKTLRERRKLTQKELATRAGTRQPNIARIERGTALPKLELLTKIASALGCRFDVRFVSELRQV